MYETPLTALVLSGGGARAAYQVGVLHALMQLRREHGSAEQQQRNPFGILCGTSAGALNAAALAAAADQFEAAVEMLQRIWRDFHAEQVYRADVLGGLHAGSSWLTVISLGRLLQRWRRLKPRSVLDNTPLAELLERLVPLHRLPRMLRRRHLQALAIGVSSYSSGEHVTFFQSAAEVTPWSRLRRAALPAEISHAHLLASSAIPFIFPPVALQHADSTAWYGDGSMRQTAPLSPAIHLGAQRLVVIGAGRMQEPVQTTPTQGQRPSFAQVGGHALASIFLDGLAADVERLERVNQTVALLPEASRRATPLRHIDALVIAPSQRLDEIAARHQHALPAPLRAVFGQFGLAQGNPVGGAALASYLLFESAYTRELIALGEADTMSRRDEVLAFFRWRRG